jgi:hypothetical protein
MTSSTVVGYDPVVGNLLPAGYTAGAFVNGPYRLPVLVGNIRIDQAWGAAQIMGGVLHNTTASNFTSNTANNGTITSTGWAIGAGLKINLPMIAPGDVLNMTAAYADGALDWLQSASTSARTGGIGREFGGLLRQDKNMYVFPSADCTALAATAVTTSCFDSEQTKGYSMAAMFTHYWTPTLRSNFIGSYLSLTPGTVTRHTDWTLGGLSKANVWEVGGNLVWSPARNFDIGVELTYEHLNQKLAANPGAAPTPIPAAWGNWKPSSSIIQTRLRVQRTF